MLLKLNLKNQKQKSEKRFHKIDLGKKKEKEIFDIENIIKNEEFQSTLSSFKNKINELLFSELCLDQKKCADDENNQNNDFIPKFFRDKIHSLEKIEGHLQECVSCHQNSYKTEYFCEKCKIPIHPECFTIYHNSFIYNSNFDNNECFILKQNL